MRVGSAVGDCGRRASRRYSPAAPPARAIDSNFRFERGHHGNVWQEGFRQGREDDARAQGGHAEERLGQEGDEPQAGIAIGLSEARKEGGKVPAKKTAAKSESKKTRRRPGEDAARDAAADDGRRRRAEDCPRRPREEGAGRKAPARTRDDPDRHRAAHAVGFHVGAAAALHDLAALHHQVAVGELGGEVVVLLDEDDRHALRLPPIGSPGRRACG